MPARWTSGQCPACGATITGQRRTCPSCRLDLVADELAKIAYTTRFLNWARREWLLDERSHVRLRQELDGARGVLAGTPWLPAAAQPAQPRPAQHPQPAQPVAAAGPARVPASPGWTAPVPRAPRAARPRPRRTVALAAWLRRAWRPVASDLGVHGLAYLGVLLMFAGTLGLALFSLRSVNTSLRPPAEVAVPLVLLVSSWLLGRRGAPLVAASLELLGGAVLPVLAFASLLDGSSVPPDLRPGPLLVAVLSAVAAGLAGVYGLVARRRPATMLRYLVGPLAWTAAGVLGLALHRGPSAAQMALVSVAVAATLLVARRRPRHRLSSPTEMASIPGAALAVALVLAFAAAEGWPLWPALTATAATLLTIELLASRFPTATLVALAQSLTLGIGLAAAAPRLGWATSGAALLAGTLVLLEWHARRRPDPVVALAVLAVAAAGLLLAMAAPWTAVTAAAVAGVWAHTRRIRPLAGPFSGSGQWAAALALAACLAPLGLVSGLERALPEGHAWVVLAGLTVPAALAVRRWRPGDRLYSWLVPAAAALAVLATAGEWLAAPPPALEVWLAVAAALAGLALALMPHRPVLRTWSAAAALAWSLTLALEAAGGSPALRSLVWAALGLALVVTATAWRGAVAGHLAAIGHLLGLGALATGLPASGAVATALLAAWVAGWLVATVAAELGVAPLVNLLARVAGEGTWLARAARALPVLMVAAGLPPLLVMAADLAGLLPGPTRPQRSGLALALLALAEGAVAGRLAGRRPLAVVLSLAGVVVSAAGIALAVPDQWSAITALTSAIAVVILVGPGLRQPAMSWWAWALTAPLALLLADRAGVSGGGLRTVLGGWGALLLLGGLLLDDLRAGRRAPRQRLRLPWLNAPVALGALGLTAAVASAAGERPAVLAAWCLAGAACSLVVAVQLRVGALSGLGWTLLTVALVLLRVGDEPRRPWLGVLWAAALVGASWLLERRERGSDRWLRWDLAPLVVAHGVVLAAVAQAAGLAEVAIPGALVPGARMDMALTLSGAGLLACAVARWRRGWPWALAGGALTLIGAAVAGTGWLALALAGSAVGTALAAARSGHPLRGALQACSVVAGGAAWLALLEWASWSSGLTIGLTALLAGALACAVAVLIRAGRVAGDWATPIGLLAAGAIAGVLVAGRSPGAVVAVAGVVGVPSGLPGLAVAGGVALLAAAAGLAATPLGLPALRPAGGLLACGAVQVLLAAGRTPAAGWALATLALALAATAGCLALWWARQQAPTDPEASRAERAGWSWGASWLGALLPLAGAAAGAGLLAAAVDGRRGLLAAGLLVIGLEAAAGGLVMARPGLSRLAAPLACGAWLELTAEAIGGDPQWLTIPVGLTLLVVVEMTRAQGRRAGRLAVPELRLLDYAGMLLLVGAALVQTVTRATGYGLVASLLGIGLCVWGAATRVRRRVVVGSVTLLLALFGMIVMPVAQMVPEFRGAALWIVLTAVGFVLIAVAVSLEQGRARLAAAASRIDRLMEGWE
jgi:hypothetical protein